MTLLHLDATATVGTRQLRARLDVAPREVVALIGPNGAGKSSLLALATGLLLPDDGEVVRAPEAGIGWAPQGAGLLPRRRVREQVEAFARPDRSPLAAQGIDQLLQRLAVDHLADRRPEALSGGEAQRVAVARALAAGRLVLLDEPLSAQDPDGAAAVLSAVRAHRAGGGGVIVVLHRAADAWAFADRVCLMADLATGRTGGPADFGVTVLRGEVGPDHVLRAPEGELVVADAVDPGPIVAVVPSTAVTLHRTIPAGSSARNVVRCVVAELREAGGAVTIRLEGSPPLLAMLTHQAVTELGLVPGTSVWATCKASEVSVHRT